MEASPAPRRSLSPLRRQPSPLPAPASGTPVCAHARATLGPDVLRDCEEAFFRALDDRPSDELQRLVKALGRLAHSLPVVDGGPAATPGQIAVSCFHLSTPRDRGPNLRPRYARLLKLRDTLLDEAQGTFFAPSWTWHGLKRSCAASSGRSRSCRLARLRRLRVGLVRCPVTPLRHVLHRRWLIRRHPRRRRRRGLLARRTQVRF